MVIMKLDLPVVMPMLRVRACVTTEIMGMSSIDVLRVRK